MDDLLPRIRFAPHLSDRMHVCQLHTAVWGWLLARTMQGEFFVDESKPVSESLQWLNLDWDEPIDDSGKPLSYLKKRDNIQQQVLSNLVQTEQAHQDESGAVYLALPSSGQTIVTEALRGELVFQNERERVMVAEDNGRFLPPFATLIDDHYLQVTHAVRPHTDLAHLPIYHQFYHGLGWVEPVWLVLPQLVDKERIPLSLTDATYHLEPLQETGYLPQALLNYLWLLGWSPEEKIVGKWSAQQTFQREALSPRPTLFDWVDFNWLNKQYIQSLSDTQLAEQITPFLQSAYPVPESKGWLETVTIILRHHLTTLSDAVPAASWIFDSTLEPTPEGLDALTRPESKVVLLTLIAELAQLVVLDLASAESLVSGLRNRFLQERGWNGRYVLSPIRAALIGHVTGPTIPHLLAILGKEETLQRLAHALKRYSFHKS